MLEVGLGLFLAISLCPRVCKKSLWSRLGVDNQSLSGNPSHPDSLMAGNMTSRL